MRFRVTCRRMKLAKVEQQCYLNDSKKYRHSRFISSPPFPNIGRTHLPIPFVLAFCTAHRTTPDSQRAQSHIARAMWLHSICFHCTRIPFRGAPLVELKSPSNKSLRVPPAPETYRQFRRARLAVVFATTSILERCREQRSECH